MVSSMTMIDHGHWKHGRALSGFCLGTHGGLALAAWWLHVLMHTHESHLTYPWMTKIRARMMPTDGCNHAIKIKVQLTPHHLSYQTLSCSQIRMTHQRPHRKSKYPWVIFQKLVAVRVTYFRTGLHKKTMMTGIQKPEYSLHCSISQCGIAFI